MAHLPIFHTDAAVFGHPFDEARFALLIHLSILLLDLPGNCQDGLCHGFVLLISQTLDPDIHRV